MKVARLNLCNCKHYLLRHLKIHGHATYDLLDVGEMVCGSVHLHVGVIVDVGGKLSNLCYCVPIHV